MDRDTDNNNTSQINKLEKSLQQDIIKEIIIKNIIERYYLLKKHYNKISTK